MSSVRVRMYRQGLGDCFLLTFSRADGSSWQVLIDCGALKGTPDVTARMEAVAADIRDATGGHIDVLVATHEHWDHLSGFLQASDVFETLTIGEVWVAWTEDPDDDLANELRGRRQQARRALRQALQGLAGTAEAEQIEALLDFEGDIGADGHATTRDALDWVKGRGSLRFLRPGERAPAAVAGVNAYVLGPPHDRTQIKRSDPTASGREVYELGGTAGDDRGFYAAVGALETDDERPFDRFFCVPEAEAGAFAGEYLGEAWRRIDRDWLGVATRLALQLNSDTNNTSLVLAFELGDGGPVLLFPGDAQVGNWLSWGALTWPRTDGSVVRSDDLLARTVLYKVGHHGSHNATLRERGLELMTSPDLVAMIPVDRETARKKGWAMPFPPLFDRLTEKTRGRILDAEQGRLGAGWGALEPRTGVEQWFLDYTVEW
ncbi:MAG TPA: hypothetical protein VFG79_00615 [Solirubrobacter sp.]|nr:hypothetical protein [Solirubrobacter sp.]